MNNKIKGILHLLKFKTKLYFRGKSKYDLLIYDDFFPNPLTGYRLDEFTYLLNNIKQSGVIIDSEKNYGQFGYSQSKQKDHLSYYNSNEGKNISLSRVRFASKFNNINCKVLYVLFYFNLLRIYKFLEFFRIPYVFTLYPGGGFVINDENVDRELKRLLSSPLCKAVIVNQNFTKQYLLEKGLCGENKINLIFGLPVASIKLKADIKEKKYYPFQKDKLDICFVSNKYTTKGQDKGYDIFIETAILLYKQFDYMRFHVIGNFSHEDIDVMELKDKINFLGSLNANDLSKTLMGYDMIISPNRPFVYRGGSFDGFPLGTCVEASLAGCCVVASDVLSENRYYRDNDEMIIIEPEVSIILKRLLTLLENPDKISEIGKAGRMKTQLLYSEEKQMKQRCEIIKKVIEEV